MLVTKNHGTICSAHRELYPPGLWRWCSLCKHGHPAAFFVKGATRCVYCVLNPEYTRKFAAHVRKAADDHLREMINANVLSDWRLNDSGQPIFKCPCAGSFRGRRVKRAEVVAAA